ncbi:hypothetical protein QJS04_geneDACA020426 [Acorus gramineus]|uniref:Uncharacterized protein n=1 Tax=Acorus gramineus TaxID=55184 RepID=A0AAV9BTS2_ACOGR|nr:hypothetical protein QJS04_geneDACA020426 [Acorus gramineus]
MKMSRGFVVCILLVAFMFASAMAREAICIGDCALYPNSCPQACMKRSMQGQCVWFQGGLNCCCHT